MPLPLTVSELGPVLQLVTVLATRNVIKGQHQIPQILVQWINGQDEEASWEDLEDINASYPQFNLEVGFKGEGDVTNTFVDGSSNNVPKVGELANIGHDWNGSVF
ncbi:hypothetical protein QL285_076042 [Trifolium repens]|nr:hypothetical protein QL285_076042 [Trifolium repens]